MESGGVLISLLILLGFALAAERRFHAWQWQKGGCMLGSGSTKVACLAVSREVACRAIEEEMLHAWQWQSIVMGDGESVCAYSGAT